MQTSDGARVQCNPPTIRGNESVPRPVYCPLPVAHTVDITFRKMPLDEELFQGIRDFCQLVGGSLCEGSEWNIVLERLRASFRVTTQLLTPQGIAQHSAEGTDPYGAALRSIACLLER